MSWGRDGCSVRTGERTGHRAWQMTVGGAVLCVEAVPICDVPIIIVSDFAICRLNAVMFVRLVRSASVCELCPPPLPSAAQFVPVVAADPRLTCRGGECRRRFTSVQRRPAPAPSSDSSPLFSHVCNRAYRSRADLGRVTRYCHRCRRPRYRYWRPPPRRRRRRPRPRPRPCRRRPRRRRRRRRLSRSNVLCRTSG